MGAEEGAMWWLAAAAFGQTVITGADYAGDDLRPLDGDILSGVFTNVGQFVINASDIVRVQPGVDLEVYADAVIIDGTLDGTGGGLAGGAGAPAGAFQGNDASGPGRGTGGLPGPCVHGGGGGGGGYGGPGGDGSYYFAGQGQGGPANGDEFDPALAVPGSGGGGGGSGCDLDAGSGGSGGARIVIVAGSITIDGALRSDGARGQDGLQWSGGGGGGSGGSIYLDGALVDGEGEVTAKGGDGGDTVQGIGGLAGGGGGGGGGRIFIYYGSLAATLTTGSPGGTRGVDQSIGFTSPGQNGMPGTVYTLLTDPDIDDDGIEVPNDNCPSDPNPDQADADNDGIGDACDPCPNDPVDSDGDGVCDSIDVCLGANDTLDLDEDGEPDGCDCDPEDPLAGTSRVESCDEVDNNCNGYIDEPGSEGEQDFFLDIDGDGFGNGLVTRRACVAPLNFVLDRTDCDDDRFDVFPGAEELCDSYDNDCDGEVDVDCSGEKPAEEAAACGCDQPSLRLSWLLAPALLAISRRREAATGR